mgnify:CR=1 FL=1
MNTFISVEEAREAILERIAAVSSERVTLADAAGRRLREEIIAPFDAPAFDNSAMDGFALRAAEANGPLRVVGESAAGAPYHGALASGEAVRIMTGATIPADADCVVMRENAVVDEAGLRVTEPPQVGANIRRRGAYLQAGAIALAAGSLVRPADVGLLATFGRTVVYVGRRPRVTIVTTGSELVEPDRPLRDGQIVNSNAYMLEALVRATGTNVTVAPIVPDDAAATRDALESATRSADLLLTVGGVSVGDYDFVRAVLDELSGGMQFWKVRMKPGKPLAFGMLAGRVPAIGLPGNPVSSFVGFHQFVRPALAALAGAPRAQTGLMRTTAKAACAIRSTPARRQYVLGAIEGESFRPYPDQSSGNPLVMRGCTALGIIDEGVSAIESGAAIVVELL